MLKVSCKSLFVLMSIMAEVCFNAQPMNHDNFENGHCNTATGSKSNLFPDK